MQLQSKVRAWVATHPSEVMLRKELKNLGSQSQVGRVIAALIRDGVLARLERGLYVKTRQGKDGEPILGARTEDVAFEILMKLGRQVRVVQEMTSNGKSTFRLESTEPSKRRRRRQAVDVTNRPIEAAEIPAPVVPESLDDLPTKQVGEYITRLARAYKVVFKRSQLDDLAEAITRAAGDDVSFDATQSLLIALAERSIVSKRQTVRLLLNYKREVESVRSV